MKKIFKNLSLILIVSFGISCSPTKELTEISKNTEFYAVDFREFVDKEFLFMTDIYYGEYDVLGIIHTKLLPTVIYKTFSSVNWGIREYTDILSNLQMDGFTNNYIGIVGNNRGRYVQYISIENPQELLNFIYNKSIEWGGNGFHKLRFEMKYDYTDEDDNRTIYYYFEMTGEIIKRK